VDGHICRKCGALLPISSKEAPRMKISFGSKQKDTKSKNNEIQNLTKIPSEKNQFEKKQTSKVDLQDIPMEKDDFENEDNDNEEFDKIHDEIKNLFYGSNKQKKSSILSLEEITPKPFDGSLIAKKGIYGKPDLREKSKPKIKSFEENKSVQTEKSTTRTSNINSSRVQKLEQDMINVLSVLSQKFKVPEAQEQKKTKKNDTLIKKKEIPPSNMSEILQELMTIDMRIEASAIIKTDGTILASAISNRISDTLFSTIGQNLAMLGNDIVEGLNAGILKSISVKGSEGVIDLAPIDPQTDAINDMLIIIFSDPRVKSGIINIAVSLLKKSVKEYLGIES
jgi:predicted regulator of Ras-like GTPase activity (Roadblock/LC7/MglB family)